MAKIKKHISGDAQGVRFNRIKTHLIVGTSKYKRDLELFKNTEILYPLSPTTIPKAQLSKVVDAMLGQTKS